MKWAALRDPVRWVIVEGEKMVIKQFPKYLYNFNQLTLCFSVVEKEAQPDLLNDTRPVPPKRLHRPRKNTPPRPISNGLPPTPKVHMGACFSKIFNGCPLRIHCTASWIHPETRDQHLIIGAEEGIFNLNMNELHDAAIDQIFPRRTMWLYVIKDVLMSLSGK